MAVLAFGVKVLTLLRLLKARRGCSFVDMPNPTQHADDELLERAKHLAGQFTDPRIVTILSALLIADAINRGIGQIGGAILDRRDGGRAISS
jgi:hypothetical protein